MPYVGDYNLSTTFHHRFTTVNASGVPTTLGNTPSAEYYVDGGTTAFTAGLTLTADFNSRTGLNSLAVLCTSSATGITSGINVSVQIAAGTVSAVSLVGYPIIEYSITRRSPLRPATAGRTLLVGATGGAAVDWANVHSQDTSVDLSATTLFVVDTATAVTNNVGAIVTACNTIVPARITAQGIDVGAIVTASNTIVAARITAQGIDIGAIVTASNTIVAARITAQGINIGAIVTSFNTIAPATVTAISTIAPARVTAQGIDIGAIVTAVSTIVPARVTAQGIDVGAIVTAVSTIVPARVTAQGIDVGAIVTVFNTIAAARVTVISASGLASLFLTDSGTTYASAVAGSPVAEIADNAGGTTLTVTGIAAGVWDEDATDHQTQGSFGQAIGDPVADSTTLYQAVVTDAAGTDIAADIISIKADVTAIRSKVTGLTYTSTDRVDANIRAVANVTVTGFGTVGNTWGP